MFFSSKKNMDSYTPIASLLQDEPSNFSIEALEDSVVIEKGQTLPIDFIAL
jgi:hypothetical protein